MNLAMTVGATAVEKEHRVATARIGRMTSPCHVALRAQPRVGDFQQPVIDRAMGLMAVGAIFEGWRMLVEKWAASFGMAGVAVLVDASLLQLRRIRRAMRVVTIRAGQLALSHRHMR